MKVLFTTLREKSHFLALRPFVEAFRRQGHDVAVSAPPDFADQVAPTGATFIPFGHPGDAGLEPIWTKLRVAKGEEQQKIVLGEVFAGACAKAAIPTLIRTLETWRPSLVARESFEFAGHVAAAKVGVPQIRVAICARGAEENIRSYAAPFVDAHRREVSLAPDPSGDRIRDETAMTLFPPSFDVLDGPATRVWSYRAVRPSAPPLPDWWNGRREPFVYVTLGTVAGRFDMVQAAYRVAIDAVSTLPIRALLTIGSALPMEALGVLPPNLHVERFVPQDDVIPHAAAVVCHGGSGTVIGALAAGVPMVVAPMFADQPHNAARVAAIGAGLALDTRSEDASALKSALSRVLDDASFRTAARRVSHEIATLPSIDDAASDADRWVHSDAPR